MVFDGNLMSYFRLKKLFCDFLLKFTVMWVLVWIIYHFGGWIVRHIQSVCLTQVGR